MFQKEEFYGPSLNHLFGILYSRYGYTNAILFCKIFLPVNTSLIIWDLEFLCLIWIITTLVLGKDHFQFIENIRTVWNMVLKEENLIIVR